MYSNAVVTLISSLKLTCDTLHAVLTYAPRILTVHKISFGIVTGGRRSGEMKVVGGLSTTGDECPVTVFLWDLPMYGHTKFQPNNTQTMTALNAPMTRPSLNGRSADPETPKMAERYFRPQIWWLILNRETRIPIRVS